MNDGYERRGEPGAGWHCEQDQHLRGGQAGSGPGWATSFAAVCLNPRDAEDILQEVFYELGGGEPPAHADRHVTGWLFRVARNRIIDLFRKKKPESFSDAGVEDEDGELLRFGDLLPSPAAGPDALYARGVLLDELEAALDECPTNSARCLWRMNWKDLASRRSPPRPASTSITLLSRKRYAVLHLRERLQQGLRRVYESMRNRNMISKGSAERSRWYLESSLWLGHHRRCWTSGTAAVELAIAVNLRLAADHLLASVSGYLSCAVSCSASLADVQCGAPTIDAAWANAGRR